MKTAPVNYAHDFYRPQRKLLKVMFSEMSVSHSAHGEVGISGPMSFLEEGIVVSGTRSFLGGEYSGVNTQGWILTPTCPGAGYSPLPPTTTAIKWWPSKHVRLANGQYASYWNASLFKANVRRHLACGVFLMWKGVLNTNSFPSIANNSGSYPSAMF